MKTHPPLLALSTLWLGAVGFVPSITDATDGPPQRTGSGARLAAAAAAGPAGGEAIIGRIAAGLRAAGAKTRGGVGVEVFRKAAPATVLVVAENSSGTGSLIDDGGTILTNHHVINEARRIWVVFRPKDGTRPTRDDARPARLIRADPVRDLALLRVEPSGADPLPLGDMANVEVGQDVHAIGHPQGEEWSYTTGIISQVRRDYEWSDGRTRHKNTVIQTQTPINPGNSGGPLLNDKGELVGVNTFVRRDSEGINYAIAVDSVKEFLKSGSGEGPDRPFEEPPAEEHPRPGPGAPPAAERRTETYDGNIVGVYMSATEPPPDIWLVYRGDPNAPAYAAHGRLPTRIDTVVQSSGKEPGLNVFLDANCDGTVDVVGHSARGDGTIDGFGLPEAGLRLDALAWELARGLERGLIRHREVMMCR